MKTLLPVFGLAMVACVALYAKTYQYRCPKCGLVLSYEQPGIVKCPQDSSNMIPKW